MRPVTGRGRKRWAALVALAAALVAATGPADAGERAGARRTEADAGGRAARSHLIELDGFIVPVMDEGRLRRNFVLMLTLELYDEDDRPEVWRLIPPLRDEIYQMLFRTVSFRTRKPRIPEVAHLRRQLVAVARRVAGEGRIKSVIVRRAVEEAAR